MKLDINLIKKEPFYCTEKMLATVGEYFKRNYEMVFADCIASFHIKNTEEFMRALTESPLFQEERLLQNLKRFHGIGRYRKTCSTFEDAVNFIRNELMNGRPVVIFMDVLYQRWLTEKDYVFYAERRRENIKDFGVLILYGMEEEVFYCLDVHSSNKEQTILYNDLEKGMALEAILGFQLLDDFESIQESFNFLRKRIESFFEYTEFGLNVYDQISMFAKDIVSFDVYKWDTNIHGYKPLYFLKGCINKLYRERYLFSLSLGYVADRMCNMKLQQLSNQYKEAVSVWYMAFLITVRANVRKEYDKKSLVRLAELINKASEEEKAVMQSIIISEGLDRKMPKQFSGTAVHVDDTTIPFFVQLHEFYNSNSFMCAYDNLHNDELFYGECLVKGKYCFKLSRNIFSTNFDNISCEGQEINLPHINGNVIRLLGYGEDGNFSGIGKLVYVNGVIDEFIIAFSRFDKKLNYDVQYKENELMWEGFRNGQEYDMGSYISRRSNMRIFAMSHNINADYKLQQIILPSIPYIHILAITIDVNKK